MDASDSLDVPLTERCCCSFIACRRSGRSAPRRTAGAESKRGWGRVRATKYAIQHITPSLVIILPPNSDSIQIQFRFNSDSIQIQFRFNSDSIQIQFRFNSDSIQIQFRFSSDSLQIQFNMILVK
ncbi:hypothetical protein ACN38_g9888 [Penicillium nordicum]|uniref:Uncharacterized protein n=1 Tax=Penicillium nordicum TaxID=229535 RepID=A0A0M8P2V6_9EURO|nr:hypothetical protein ACN38_g9888 [Penicillium nordicum]